MHLQPLNIMAVKYYVEIRKLRLVSAVPSSYPINALFNFNP